MRKSLQYLTLRLNNASLVFSVLFCCGVFSLSCNYFAEPEPFVNMKAAPLSIKPYAPTNFEEGDTLCGGYFIRFNPEEPFSTITSYFFYIDSIQISEATTEKYEFFFDTKLFQTGKHTLYLEVYSTEPNQGLENLKRYPTSIYSMNLFFVNKPIPQTPRDAINGWNTRKSPWRFYVSWSYSSFVDTLAQYYILVRTAPNKKIDTIYNMSLQYYEDTTVTNNPVHYKIGAVNQYGINYSDCKWQSIY